ncbi:MAG: helix-turn-helix transcriptional regulator [Thermoleophilia bacterium]|nr:helix-turn-helix transcriptional regulator [Thermoleophilia bacterium]
MSAASLLRQARLTARLSQRALADRARTSQARISRIERGVEDPSYGQLEKLVGACGLEFKATVTTPGAIARDDLRETAADLARAAELSRFLTSVAIAGTKTR